MQSNGLIVGGSYNDLRSRIKPRRCWPDPQNGIPHSKERLNADGLSRLPSSDKPALSIPVLKQIFSKRIESQVPRLFLHLQYRKTGT